MRAPEPPRLLAWLVARALPRTLREPVLGDLAESHARRARLDGRAAATWMYLREGWMAVRALGALSNEPTPLTPPRAPFDGLGADLRFAIRLHLRRPASTLLVLVTLGLAIGASTALYSVLKPTLLDPLPYPAGERLGLVWERDDGGSRNLGFTTVADVRDQMKSFDRVAALGYWAPTWLGISDPLRLSGQQVSHTFFGMLGVSVALGRDFVEADDRQGADRVAIVSHRLWRERMGADAAVVGRAISLDGYPYTIIGVLPDTFESLLAPGVDIWRALRYEVGLDYACRDCRHLRGLARVAPGVSLQTAAAELEQVASRLRAAYPQVYSDRGMTLEPLKQYVTKGSTAALTLLFAAVVMILAIACVNVANLLLAQAVRRRQEFAVRMAVGSGRERLLRQVMLESVLLGAGGSLVAVLLTWALFGPIRAAASLLPRAGAVTLDWQVLVFGGVVGLVAGAAFGLLPALASLESGHADLRLGTRVTPRHNVRRALVVAEVALASALVVGAVVLGKGMSRLMAVDPGFRVEGLMTANIQVAGPDFAEDSTTWQYWARVREAVLALPGVAGASLVSQLPLGGGFDTWGVRAESRAEADPNDAVSADRYAVMPGYFETMGIPLVAGRMLGPADRAGSEPVVVVSETLVRAYFRGESPLGQRIRIGGGDRQVWRTVVGVVGDVRHHGLDQPGTPQVYLPTDQFTFADGTMDVVVRTAGNPAALVTPVREAIRSLHPDPTINAARPVTAVVADVLARRRLVVILFGGFTVLSLTLAAVGIYGVMANGVAERSRELGVRAALGATSSALRRSILRESLALGVLGLVPGLGVAAAIGKALDTLPFGVELDDPAVFLATAAALLATVFLAAWVPARRAARHDPAVALQAE